MLGKIVYDGSFSDGFVRVAGFLKWVCGESEFKVRVSGNGPI